MTALAVLLLIAGLAGLTLSDGPPSPAGRVGPLARFRIVLRCLGFATLAASAVLCGQGAGWSVGLVKWLGWLTAVSLAVVFLLRGHEAALVRQLLATGLPTALYSGAGTASFYCESFAIHVGCAR